MRTATILPVASPCDKNDDELIATASVPKRLYDDFNAYYAAHGHQQPARKTSRRSVPMLLPHLREQVAHLHHLLPDNHLVVWTSGNISARDPTTGLVVIKPSGIKYDELTPENMVVVDAQGQVVEGPHVPSSDTASHCYIYRQMPDVHGVVHTHSRYATAFAAVGKPIPCVLTAIADEFGGDIPCGSFAPIGGEEIGAEVVKTLEGCHSPAALLQNHGVFTIGTNAEAAVKAAIMVEDNAATVWHALQLGQPLPIPAAMIAQLHHRYTHVYGQPKEIAS